MLATCLEKNFSSNQAPHSTTIPTCLAAWLPACPRACLPARLPACSIGQDSQHLRRLHTRLLRLGCGPAGGAWQLQALEPQSPSA